MPNLGLQQMDALVDRIARLAFLCSQFQTASSGQPASKQHLQEALKEAEDLCRALRVEIKRREVE